MIGRTYLASSSKDGSKKPLAVLFPGGPGLSSQTIRSLDLLSRSFDLLYLDPPGTGDSPALETPSFRALVDTLVGAIGHADRPLLLIGHSYGGFYATEIAVRKEFNVWGLVFLSIPMQTSTYDVAVERFEKHKDDELKKAEEVWTENPTDETFRNWLAGYGALYFHSKNIKAGAELLLRDRVSNSTFLALVDERVPSTRSIAAEIRDLPIHKLLLAGGADMLFPPEDLRTDAEAAGAEFAIIPDASHFLMFDQPEAVVRQIESWSTNSSKGRSIT